LKKDISVPSDATRVSVQPRKVEEPKKVKKPKETGVSSNAFTQLPAPLQIVRAIGWGISSGRKQRAVEEAFLSGVDTGGGVSPSSVEKARKGELGPLDFRTLSQRAWVEPGTPEERIAAGKAVEEAIARAEASPMPLARRQALAALEKGASKELVLA